MSCNDKLYPLKHHQVSMMCSLIAGQDYYYEKLVYRISGQLEVSRFIKTWQILSSHNDVLRSIYKWDNTKLPLQVVIEGKEIPILLFKTKEEYQSNPEYAEFKVDISINPLVVFLICVDSETYEMALHTHHILMDGWSHAVLINQFLTVYTLGAWPDGISSKALYSAYIEKYISNCLNNQNYWLDYLHRISLQKYSRKRTERAHKGYYTDTLLEKEYFNVIRELRLQQFTFSDVIFGYLAVTLKCLDNSNMETIGMTFSGRENIDKGAESLMGMLISTVPVSVDLDRETKFCDLLYQIKLIKLSHIEHVDYDINQLIAIDPSIPVRPYTNVLVIQNYPINLVVPYQKIHIKLIKHEYCNDMDFSLGIRVGKSKIFMDYSYSVSIFRDRDIQFIANGLHTFLLNVGNGCDVWSRSLGYLEDYLRYNQIA